MQTFINSFDGFFILLLSGSKDDNVVTDVFCIGYVLYDVANGLKYFWNRRYPKVQFFCCEIDLYVCWRLWLIEIQKSGLVGYSLGKVYFTKNCCTIKIRSKFFNRRHLMSFTDYCFVCIAHVYTDTNSECFFGTTTISDTHGVGFRGPCRLMSSCSSFSIPVQLTLKESTSRLLSHCVYGVVEMNFNLRIFIKLTYIPLKSSGYLLEGSLMFWWILTKFRVWGVWYSIKDPWFPFVTKNLWHWILCFLSISRSHCPCIRRGLLVPYRGTNCAVYFSVILVCLISDWFLHQ